MEEGGWRPLLKPSLNKCVDKIGMHFDTETLFPLTRLSLLPPTNLTHFTPPACGRTQALFRTRFPTFGLVGSDIRFTSKLLKPRLSKNARLYLSRCTSILPGVRHQRSWAASEPHHLAGDTLKLWS